MSRYRLLFAIVALTTIINNNLHGADQKERKQKSDASGAGPNVDTRIFRQT